MRLYREERYLGAVGLLSYSIVKEQRGGLLQKPPRSGLVQLVGCRRTTATPLLMMGV
jgi:hypothetical protein